MKTYKQHFIDALSLHESNNNPFAFSSTTDSGRACGRFQIHPSMYSEWGPKPSDFGGVEHDWDWAFNFAVSNFYDAAIKNKPLATATQIAMAFHLHGYINWTGWDGNYAQGFTIAWNATA